MSTSEAVNGKFWSVFASQEVKIEQIQETPTSLWELDHPRSIKQEISFMIHLSWAGDD